VSSIRLVYNFAQEIFGQLRFELAMWKVSKDDVNNPIQGIARAHYGMMTKQHCYDDVGIREREKHNFRSFIELLLQSFSFASTTNY
jgi:hypothetical protein